jgi:hypothetical protein
MAQEQYGDTWHIVRLPDGSELITTEDELTSADTISFGIVVGLSGEVCWGDDNPTEANIRDFAGNITAGSGYRIIGTGDAEKVELEAGGWFELETWNFGVTTCKLTEDKYETGSGSITLKYKNGNSEANCEADSWTVYTAPFACTGWIKIRVEEG